MEYRIAKTYVDKGGKNHPEDEFSRYFNIPGSGMLNSPGIRPLHYATNLKTKIGLPAYLILVTHEKTAGELNPWEDIIDINNAEILYWGDARKDDSKKIDDFKGNFILRNIHDRITTNGREHIPPILHFSKPKAGKVKFNGLCVLDKLDLSWFDDHGTPVQNYHAKLTVLDSESVDTDWLHSRANCGTIGDLDKHPKCPPAWKSYKSGNKQPINIFSKSIRSKTNQLPKDAEDLVLLSQLTNLNPFSFEGVIVALFKQLKDVHHTIHGTKPTGDGGFDFHGTFRLPRPMDYKIKFKGEVKRYATTTAVDPKSVSRLVARLSRQEYGIFVTTSYFTEQAQQEVLADEYPVHLISGIDLVNIIKELKLTKNGRINPEWLSSVTQS